MHPQAGLCMHAYMQKDVGQAHDVVRMAWKQLTSIVPRAGRQIINTSDEHYKPLICTMHRTTGVFLCWPWRRLYVEGMQLMRQVYRHVPHLNSPALLLLLVAISELERWA